MPADSILAHAVVPLFPSPPCRTPGGGWATTDLQDKVESPQLRQLPPLEGWGGLGGVGHLAQGFLPCGKIRRLLGYPTLHWCQVVADQGAVTRSLWFPFSPVFPFLSPWHPKSESHQTHKPPSQLEKHWYATSVNITQLYQ